MTLLTRFWLSVLFFLGGMNVIAFAMIGNGYNSLRNPVWQMLGGFLDLERDALKLVACLALFGIVVFVVMFVIPEIWNFFQSKSESVLPIKTSTYQFTPNYELPKKENKPMAPVIERHQENPVTALPAKKQVIIPRKLTPEELKKKAINQIMGGRSS
jgi:hypothetical protein